MTTERTSRRGRPAGTSPKSLETRERLYREALSLIGRQGFAEATLRDIAASAGVSVGLVYRYFPTKHAIVLALYDDLSREFAERTASLPAGTWSQRFEVLLRESLAVLRPHRTALQGLIPVLVSSGDEGLFSASASAARMRVQGMFERAVSEATDAPAGADGQALGRSLYLVHLAVLLWWLLDASAEQRATRELVGLIQRGLSLARLTLVLPGVRSLLRELDGLVQRAFLSPPRSRR